MDRESSVTIRRLRRDFERVVIASRRYVTWRKEDNGSSSREETIELNANKTCAGYTRIVLTFGF